MKMLAHRLYRETTVVATQIAMGTVEEVYRMVFPDPRSRPTFLIGVMTHGVWEAPDDASNPSRKKDDLKEILTQQRLKQATFTAVYAGFGTVKLGPLSVIRHDLSGGLSLEDVTEFVVREMSPAPEDLHPILIDVLDGREMDVEAVSGWFVQSGNQHTPPVYCHTHQAMIDEVKAKMAKIKIKRKLELKELEDKTKPEQKEKKCGPKRKNLRADDDTVEIDRVETTRMRKEMRQYELLGNQPMPETITTPSISPLGNPQIRIRRG